ncbi:unnamed protein product [Rotaria sp. Silwood2]|nr:unnamed protein product [Rotaria sp. Silwood2]
MSIVFVIDQNGHATITTAISQLERTPENEQLFTDIAQVFEAMLLAFQETEIIEQSVQPGNNLQVFVQAQSYNLKSGHKPIDLHCYSSRILAPLNIIIPILDEANQGCLLIEPILNKIIEHLGPSSCKKLEDTKEFRAHVRKAMIKEESE